MRRVPVTTLLLLLASAIAFAAPASRPVQSLAGEWQFAFDAKDEGVSGRWFERDLPDTIQLPGTTETREKGPLNETSDPLRLTRLRPYGGPAWYARKIQVPAAWQGQRVVLRLERTKPSRLWLDSRPLGEQDSLTTPHEYALGLLAPGEHRLCLRIDNGHLPPLGDPHQWSDHTQTNWNGIIGALGLVAVEDVALDQVDVYPDVEKRSLRVRVGVDNATGGPVKGTLVRAGRGRCD